MTMDQQVDITEIERIVAGIGTGAEATIPILQALQEHFKYLPEPALERVCEITDITPADIEGRIYIRTQKQLVCVERK